MRGLRKLLRIFIQHTPLAVRQREHDNFTDILRKLVRMRQQCIPGRSECHVCVRTGSRTAPGSAKGLEEDGAGPSGGGGGERGIFKHRGQGQARWAFRAWGSGGDGIYRAHTQRAVRERGWPTCPPGNDRSKIHA